MQLWPVVHFFHSLLGGFAIAPTQKWATGRSCIRNRIGTSVLQSNVAYPNGSRLGNGSLTKICIHTQLIFCYLENKNPLSQMDIHHITLYYLMGIFWHSFRFWVDWYFICINYKFSGNLWFSGIFLINEMCH